MATLLRLIVQRNPPIVELIMHNYSDRYNRDENIGDLVFEILLNSSIDSITILSFFSNHSWFKIPYKREEKSGNIDLLVELISK